MSYTVTYNGVTDRSIGCHAKRRPSVPAPIPKVEVTELIGMDGAYYDSDGLYNDITISITFSFTSTDRNLWNSRYRAIKAWLYSSGSGMLKLSDDVDASSNQYYYKVKSVSLSTERISKIIGEVTAAFICDGYTYLESGDTEIQICSSTAETVDGETVYTADLLFSTLDNDYDVCHPLYRIRGSGVVTLSINGFDFSVTVNGTAYIDTDSMVTYNADSTWANTTASGDYEDLWLNPGENIYSVTLTATSAISIYMTPRWRCL